MNTTVERSIDQKLRLRNFDARNERIETGQWLRIARINVVLKEDTENAINGKQKDSGRVEIIVDSSTMGISARNRHQKSAPSSEPLAQKDGRSASRRKSLRGWSPRKFAGQSCRDYMKGNCTRSFCDYWHPPECQFCTTESGCKFGDKCSFPHPREHVEISRSSAALESSRSPFLSIQNNLALFPKRLALPKPYEEILSGCEEGVSSIRDGFLAWVM